MADRQAARRKVTGRLVTATSARKHGVSDEDIRHAHEHPIRVFELDEGFTMIIGANHAAVIYELGVVEGVPRTCRGACHEGPRQVPEVTDMPRSVQEILDHADELARRFETFEPAAEDERDAEVFAALRDAVVSRSAAERSIKTTIDNARAHGYSWAFIGTVLGTSGEAARQRYGAKQEV